MIRLIRLIIRGQLASGSLVSCSNDLQEALYVFKAKSDENLPKRIALRLQGM